MKRCLGSTGHVALSRLGAVLLRATSKLVNLLGGRDLSLVEAPPSDEDWYAKLLWLDRRKCLLLTHAGTLFPVFAPYVRKRNLEPLGSWVVGAIEAALRDEGLPPDAFGRLDPAKVALARTASRRVVGFMNQTAIDCAYQVERAGGLDRFDFPDLNRWLRRVLHNQDGYHQPIELVRLRLET